MQSLFSLRLSARTLLRIGLSLLAYFLAQILLFQFSESFGLVAAIWPPAGIALASLLLSPRPQWPALLGGLFVVGVTANLTTDRPVIACVGFMVANICETAASAWLITHFCPAPIRFVRVREVTALAVAAFFINAVTAAMGAGCASLSIGIGFKSFYGTWWTANALGLLLITPLILVWATPVQPHVIQSWGRRIETILLFATTCAVAVVLFGTDCMILMVEPRSYLLLIFVMWAALRSHPRSAVTLLVVVSLIAITCTAAGIGPFPLGGTDLPSRLLAVQFFFLVLSLSGLFLAAAVAEQQEILSQLHLAFGKLQVSDLEYRHLFDRANAGICLISTSGELMHVNEAYAQMHGRSVQEMLSLHLKDLNSPESQQHIAERMQRLLAGEFLTFQVEHYHKDGHLVPLEVSASLVVFASNALIQCFHRDISERRQMEEQAHQLLEHAIASRKAMLSALEDAQQAQKRIVLSLREKEALLKEVHHRVKNNLQIISSLLRLQSNKISNVIAKGAMLEMQNRVRSMALIHEYLYGSDNFADVDLAAYLTRLCEQLFRAMVSAPERIHLHLDFAPLTLDIGQAVPCGLLVNELVTNAFKHAFVDGRAGDVWVEFGPLPEGARGIRLRVADNGAGLPPDLDLQNLASLGLQLVSDLTRQLRGQLTHVASPGAVFVMEFEPMQNR
jgi:PAS domain S-box-containing protein